MRTDVSSLTYEFVGCIESFGSVMLFPEAVFAEGANVKPVPGPWFDVKYRSEEDG